MLSTRLVKLIESHAEDLTRGLVTHLKSHPRTPSYRHFSDAELRDRAYAIYHNLGEWLAEKSEETVRKEWEQLGRRRYADGVPLSEVISALTVIKNHLLEYAKMSVEGSSSLEVFGELELVTQVVRFFDHAAYYTAVGYEQARHSDKSVA